MPRSKEEDNRDPGAKVPIMVPALTVHAATHPQTIAHDSLMFSRVEVTAVPRAVQFPGAKVPIMVPALTVYAATHPQTIASDADSTATAEPQLAVSTTPGGYGAGLDNAYDTAYEAEGSDSDSDSVNASNGKLPYDIEKCLDIANACRSQVISTTCASPDVAKTLKGIIADDEICMTIREAAMVTLASVHRYPVRIRNEEDFLEL